jgi:hypothetical protein
MRRRVKSLTVAAVSALVLLAAATAAAQSDFGSRVVASSDGDQAGQSLRIPLALWIGGVAADQISTYKFSSGYPGVLHEVNPLIRGVDRHPALLVTAGTAIDVATGWAAFHVLGPRHPRLLKTALYAAAAYRSYLAVHNIAMMREAEAIRTAALSAMNPR